MKFIALFLTVLFCQFISSALAKDCDSDQRDRCNKFIDAKGKACSCSLKDGAFVGSCFYESDNPFLQCSFDSPPRNTCEDFCADDGLTCISTRSCSAN